MSVFGFDDDAVTTLGHFGTGLSNGFDVADDFPCTLEELCEKMEALADCCTAVLAIVLGNQKRINLLARKQETHDQRFQNLYSAIRDIRREQLRGRRDTNK